MRINHRALIYSILGVLVLLGCGISSGVAPFDGATSEPASIEATAPLPIESPTAIVSNFTPQPFGTAQGMPAMPERRRLTLEFPPQIRAGDSDVVRLTLEVDDLGNVIPTAQIGGNTVTGQVVEIPNLYESHHVLAEARFDIAGVEVRPTELVSEPLTQGTSATFYWSIHPQEVGIYHGTIWLYLRFVDKKTGEESRNTVSAQIVEIKAVNLLGLSANFARATGMVGSVIGTIIGFPFLEDIVKFFFKRRIKQN